MQKPQNISVLKSDPDLEPPTILFDSISIEFLSPLSRKLPRRAKHNSYPRIPIHRVLTEPELRNISPRNSSRIPLIRWSRSRVSIGIVHRWFISMLGARAPATQDRRFSPLPSPSPPGSWHGCLFSPLRNPSESSSWLSAKCRAKRYDKAASSSFKRCILVRARCVTSLSIISYVYTCTYHEEGRIHTGRTVNWLLFREFFSFLPIAAIEEVWEKDHEKRSIDCSSNGDNWKRIRSATVSFWQKVEGIFEISFLIMEKYIFVIFKIAAISLE